MDQSRPIATRFRPKAHRPGSVVPSQAPSPGPALHLSGYPLRYAPVALSFTREQPEGVDAFAGEVPSACTFWRRAEERTFFAPADAHDQCPVGVLTMGFPMAESGRARLKEVIATMGDAGYLRPEEACNIPSVPGQPAGIVYGPLATFPMDPDAVLVWVTPAGAMLLAEATDQSAWTPEAGGTTTLGRPSCAAIALAAQGGTTTLSLGCAGMRTYMGIDDDLELAVIPGPVLPDLSRRLKAVQTANARMRDRYRARRDRFATSVP